MESILLEIDRLRHELHKIAELSGYEEKTATLIESELRQCNPDIIETGIGGHGIIASWEGKDEGPHIIFRSELDALPIQEINQFGHKSETDGVSHKCGHDGHMSILVGLAKHLKKNPPKAGKVSLLFQPAEENGRGAVAMIESGRLKDFEPIDRFYSLHNIPGHPKHQIHCREGIFTPHVISYEIKLHGLESHAAEPENGINPAEAMSEITIALLGLRQLDKDQSDFKLVTPVYSKLGQEWYGISAGEAICGFTLRTWETSVMRSLQEDAEQIVKHIAESHQLKVETRFFEEFNSIVNDKECAEQIKTAAATHDLSFVEMSYPMNWGEDYGLFTQKYSGAMFALGSGVDMPALHNPDYDFPDEIAATGLIMFIDLIKQNGLF